MFSNYGCEMITLILLIHKSMVYAQKALGSDLCPKDQDISRY